ncbi:LIC_13387 family protein [Mucilaginibacter sp.]
MKAKILLRIAAVVMLLHTIGHTMGALTWKDAPNAAVKQVIEGMLHNRFNFMGRSASIGDFYMGYGYSMIGVLLLISILLWLLSAKPNGGIILALGFFLVFLGIIEFIYFFPFAAAFSLLAGIATLFAMVSKFDLIED